MLAFQRRSQFDNLKKLIRRSPEARLKEPEQLLKKPPEATEAEDIKKRWQQYTEELYKKDLHDPDNHDGVITHLEPDILECEVKWASGSITTNKASGGNGIPVELFQILKDDAVKCCTQYASKFGKLSSGHRTEKVSFHSNA